jgi:hypothetical protein
MARKKNQNNTQPDSSSVEAQEVLEAPPSLTDTKKYSDAFLGILVIVGLLLSVGAPAPWNVARMLNAVLVFFFAGYTLVPAHALKPRQSPVAFGQSSLVLLLSIGAGLAAAFVCWFLSAYLFKDFLLGTVGTLLFAAVGVFRIRRNRGILVGYFRSPTAWVVSLFSLMLGCYIYGAIEVQVGDHLAHIYRWDLPLHMLDAALVRDSAYL